MYHNITFAVSAVGSKPYIVKKYRRSLQIKDFAKRNWTPIEIRIVSKLVSSYGTGVLIGLFKKVVFP